MSAERNLEAVRKWLNPGGEFGVELDAELFHCCWLRHGRLLRWRTT
jgi:hypothetical protein